MFWGKLGLLLLSIFFIWILWRYYRLNPQAFSKHNFSKSFFTMGILALILIVFIFLCILFLRA